MDYVKLKNSTLFLKYVIPQMIGLVFNSIYFIVDGIFIGQRLGTQALAAAGVAVPVVEIMIALSMLISVGAGIMISSETGRGKIKEARSVFNIAMIFTLAFSIAIMAAGLAFCPPFARALGASDTILGDTVTYMNYFLGFCPFLIFSFVLSTFARNDGKPALAMWALTIGSVTNIILDYVFMYPLNMGIAGAALATGLGPVFSVLILLPHFLRKKGNLFFEKVRFSFKTIGKLGINGLPAFVAEFSIGFVTLLYNLAIVRNGLGEDGLASYVVIGYAALICLTAFLGAAQGVQPAVSFFKGAGMKGRIISLFRTTVVFNVILGMAFYALLFFFGKGFFGIFIDNDPALLNFTASSARIYFINLPFAAVNILMISFMQSMEKVGSAMAVSLSRSTAPVIVFLLVLPLLFAQNGLWMAITCTEAVTFILGVVLWKKMLADERPSRCGNVGLEEF